MYKNQLQELAQRSCFNLPSYACVREGPDHAPRFKASVNFNGESFDSPSYCTTLRQAEHSAAEVALNTLSTRGPSRSLTAKVLDETGVYKNLLQETAHRAGLNLPVYTTVRSGPGHVPIFTCSVELAGMNFSGEPAKTKKQAEKNAAMAAWSSLKHMPNMGSSCQTNKATVNNEEQEQVVVARVLSQFKPKDENKTGRERDLNLQSRRKMVSDYRDQNNQHVNSLQFHQWRSMGLFTEVTSVMYPIPSQHQNQKQNHFLAQLPPPTILQQQQPPPVRTKDNPFLYSPNRSIPVQIRSRNQAVVNTQEVPTPVEEHQKDEDEWLSGKSFVTDKSIEKDTSKVPYSTASVFRPRPSSQTPLPHIDIPILDHRTQQTQVRTTPFGPPHPSMVPNSFPRFLNTGLHCAPQGVAPAVQIRSVIPVCATPPVRVAPSSSTAPTPSQVVKEASVVPVCATLPVRASPDNQVVKEASTSLPSVSDTHVSTPTTTEQEVTPEGSSLKMNKLQL